MLQYIFYLILIAICITAWRIYIRPFIGIEFYKAQGCEMIFTPFSEYFNKFNKDVHFRGDVFYKLKQLSKRNPVPTAIGGNVGSNVHLMIHDPTTIREFLNMQENHYKKHPQWFKPFQILLGDGLFFAEGNVWRKHKRAVAMALNSEYLREMIPYIVRIVDDSLDKMNIQELKEIKSLKIVNKFREISNEILGKLFFGDDYSEYTYNDKPLSACIEEMLDKLSDCDFLTPGFYIFGRLFLEVGFYGRHKELMRNIKGFRNHLCKLVSQRISLIDASSKVQVVGQARKTLIDVFWEQRNSNADYSLNDEEIVDMFLSFFLSGVDPTAHLAGMATFYNITNEDCQKKLQQEVNSVFSDYNNITLESLDRMEYTTAFLKESLRMTTPIVGLLERVARDDHRLGHLKIRKGTVVSSVFLPNNFNPEFHDVEDTFQPERWIDSSLTKRSLNRDPFVFTPFSAGPRNCPGQQLAMNEAKIMLGLFMKKFNYTMTDVKYQLKMCCRFLYEPLQSIMYDLSSREYIESEK